MPIRSEFNMPWLDFVNEWCLGTSIQYSELEVKTSIEALESLFPKYLDGVLERGIKGIVVILPLIELGLTLSKCENLKNFINVLNRLKKDDWSAYSELYFASSLIDLGYNPSLEPELNGKVLDILIKEDCNDIFIEVVAPELSASIRGAKDAISELATNIRDANLGMNIEVLLLRDIGVDTFQKINDEIRKAPSKEEQQQISDIALFIKSELQISLQLPITVRPRIEFSGKGYIIGVIRGTITDKMSTSAFVQFPVNDERAQRLVDEELKHFSREYMNILVMDLRGVQAGIKNWIPLIQRRFQPNINTRIGGVILYGQSGLDDGMRPLEKEFMVLRNQYAARHLPESFFEKIESVFI